MTARPALLPIPFLVALALVASLLAAAPAALPEAAASAAESVGDAVETVRSGAVVPSQLSDGDNLVRLMGGAFDPLSEAGPANAAIPRVDPATLAPDQPAAWIVQAAGRDFEATRAAITAAGGAVEGYVGDAAYLVRATPREHAAIAAAAAVRAAVLYQPAWKVPTALGEYEALADLEGPQVYRVYGYRSDGRDALAPALAGVRGAEVVTDAGRSVDVAASAEQLRAITGLGAVQWVELRPKAVPMNFEARWVNDTGVRELYSAMTPGRLTGAGQTAGVADTGVNYTKDDNGTAQTYFRDCTSATNFDTCKEADYTQASPGTEDAQLFDTVANGTNHRKMAAYFDLGGTGPNPSDDAAHGTHVAGSVTGDTGTRGVWDAGAHDGMAPAARLVHQNIGSPSGGLSIPTDSYQLFRQAYRPRDPAGVPEGYDPADYANYRPNEDARTHNNSYGLVVPVASLGSAEAADRFVWEHEDMVIVSSAGNAGPEPATVGAPSIGKNVITSGASANGRQPMVSADSMASFSSHGPAGDLRFAVDVATPGQIVISPKGGTSDEVHYLQGTSMSGPILTGLATLVRQYFYDGYGQAGGDGFAAGSPAGARQHNPSAALVRATLVNGGQRMRGWYTGDDGTNRVTDGQYPSAGQGFGLANLTQSLFFDDARGKSTHNAWFRDVYRADDEAFDVSGLVPETRTYEIDVTDAGEPLDVTMAYTDAPNLTAQGTPATVNNLDLTVTDPSGLVYSGNNFNTRVNTAADVHESLPGPVPDLRNPVEKVRIAEPATGTWTVTVQGTTVADGPQGFALAATGVVAEPEGDFTPGQPLQRDAAGSPAISNVVVKSVNADIAEVTFSTSEPTTGAVTTNVDGSPVEFLDVYNLGTGTDGKEPGYHGIDEGVVETSEDYANRPVVGTKHEVLVTGLSAGERYNLAIRATDLGGNSASVTRALRSTAAIFGSAPNDTGQLTSAPTDLPVTYDPILGPGQGFRTGTQLYAGKSAGAGILGAFMFRLPQSVDPATIRGAAVELTSGHDITNHYRDDVRVYVDLLPDELESSWQGQNYSTVHNAPSEARVNAETGSRRGGNQVYDFAFGCAQLAALRENLADVTDAERRAPFRFDGASSLATSLFGAEFGFNRRSKGADLRPRLVLYLEGRRASGRPGSVQDPTFCDPATPAPVIEDIGIQPGLVGPEADGSGGDQPVDDQTSVTVSWHTDVRSDSTVLYRRKGTTAFTQVSKPGRVMAHNVQVSGLDPNADYEFAVRSTTCNGRTATDTNGGRAYHFFYPPDPEPQPLADPLFFHGLPGEGDQASKAAGPPYTAYFDGEPPPDDADVPSMQQTTGVANTSFFENFLTAFWTGDYTGELNGPIEFDWFWSTTGVPRETTVGVTIFADPDRNADSNVQPDKIVAEGTLTIDVTAGPVPTRSVGRIDVIDGQAMVDNELVVQVAGSDLVNGNDLTVHYDSTMFPSQFAPSSAPPDPPPAAAEDLPLAGPVPPPSANATSFTPPATRHVPTAADRAAGTARCAQIVVPR